MRKTDGENYCDVCGEWLEDGEGVTGDICYSCYLDLVKLLKERKGAAN